VTQKKTVEVDGYNAVQLGFGEVLEKRLNQPMAGHLEKSGASPVKHLREFRVSDPEAYENSQLIDASVFEVGDYVDVIGTSKGKGFAGAVKRHGFRGGPKTHGQSDRWRATGSVGAGSTPGRILKGKRMPGRMGNQQVTVLNLKVVLVDADKNLLAVQGSIPGGKNGLVVVREARKSKDSGS
jgi:large subunit ribosomal protein L3